MKLVKILSFGLFILVIVSLLSNQVKADPSDEDDHSHCGWNNGNMGTYSVFMMLFGAIVVGLFVVLLIKLIGKFWEKEC